MGKAITHFFSQQPFYFLKFQMKLLLLLLIIISTVVFIIQNQQPVAIYFLGTSAKTALLTLEFSVGIWVILFSISGILTSLIMQFLNQLSSSYSPRNFTFFPQLPKLSEYSPFSKKADWGKTSQRNWDKIEQEFEEEDSWDIEKPPTESTFTRRELEQKIQEEEEQATNFEVQQFPKKASRQGSVYSYTYRELRDSEDGSLFNESVKPPPKKQENPKSKSKNVDQIYDANYRILTPPYRNDQEYSNFDQEEDQDWI